MKMEDAERLQKLVEVELKQDGFSQREIDDIMQAMTMMMLDFILNRAPLYDLRFIASLEAMVRVLKVLREDSLKDKKNADPNRKDAN